ncbi:hypothetical protein GVAV_002119 [Gurleya vavrai]
MIIFPSLRNERYKISKEDSNLILKHEDLLVSKQLKKIETIPKFFVFTENNNGSYKINDKNYQAKEAKMYHIIPKTEEKDEKIKENEQENTIENLIESFGNKKSKKLFKEYKERQKTTRENKKNYTYEEQLLPNFEQDAKSIKDIYKTENIFPKAMITSFASIKYNENDLHLDLKNIFKEEFDIEFLILDCIYKLIDKKKIFASSLNSYFINGCDSFSDYVKEFIGDRFVTDKAKDKLAMLAFVLLLIVNDFKIKFEELPKFKYDNSKIIMMLKTLGCNYSDKTGFVKLARVPTSEVVFKRLKRS